MRIDAHNPRVLVSETVREHIYSCGSKIGSVLFIKKDGSPRKLRFQLKGGKQLLVGSERGKQASATRFRNHPELVSVYDIGKQAWRSINLDTVLTVTAFGKTRRYREVLPISPGRYALAPIVRLQIGVDVS